MTTKKSLIFCAFMGLCFLWALPSMAKKQRTIAKVETVQVETPVGTAPRLPWQVWVTYSDGTHYLRLKLGN